MESGLFYLLLQSTIAPIGCVTDRLVRTAELFRGTSDATSGRSSSSAKAIPALLEPTMAQARAELHGMLSIVLLRHLKLILESFEFGERDKHRVWLGCRRLKLSATL